MRDDAVRLRGMLIDRYMQALADHLTPELRQDITLSGIFLPDVFDEYLNAPAGQRVMLIGKETKGWFKGMAHLRTFPRLDGYVQAALGEWRRIDGTKPGRSKFGQFRRKLDEQLSTQAGYPVRHHWSNLLCLDHKGNAPTGHPHVGAIATLSKMLFKAQLDVLEPDVLLFTTGVGYDRHIKQMLDITSSSVGTDRHIPGQLWSFDADGIRSLRTAHPRYAPGEAGRQLALKQL